MQDELKKFLRFLKSIELFQESGQKLSCREEDQRASNRLDKKVLGPSVSDPEGSRLYFSKTLRLGFSALQNCNKKTASISGCGFGRSLIETLCLSAQGGSDMQVCMVAESDLRFERRLGLRFAKQPPALKKVAGSLH